MLVVIAHNIRSTHNVGSLMRTSEGLGIDTVICSGYTPYPVKSPDIRLPHEAKKIDAAIQKTALNAQHSLQWETSDSIQASVAKYRSIGYAIYGLEQTSTAVELPDFNPPDDIVLVVGNEVTGIEQDVLDLLDGTLVIPMFGKKESFNVVQASAMALYDIVFKQRRK